jgi:hypothetical protein
MLSKFYLFITALVFITFIINSALTMPAKHLDKRQSIVSDLSDEKEKPVNYFTH